MKGFTVLLTDQAVRTRFAVAPSEVSMSLCKTPAAANCLAALDIESLNYQADVLLRKRFEKIKRYLPKTVTGIPICSWDNFCDYIKSGKDNVPRECPWDDAYSYLRYLAENNSISCPREINRLRFLAEKRAFNINVLCKPGPWKLKRLSLQLLFKRAGGCKEVLVSLF